MNIQSLSIDIPGGCPNNCEFCISKTHKEIKYKNIIKESLNEYRDRLQYARDKNCDTVVITGEGEPIYNMKYIRLFSSINKTDIKPTPFINIELQTSGIGLNKHILKILKDEFNIKTISLSLSNIFSSDINALINNTPKGMEVNINKLCKEIKEAGFNLRLSLNMTDSYNIDSNDAWAEETLIKNIFNEAKELEADQITFRELYQSENKNHPVNIWIKNHSIKGFFFHELDDYINVKGSPLEILPFGARKYSIDGMSVVIDDDCMSKENSNAMKYMILRPNCKLYSRWDDKGSLIF